MSDEGLELLVQILNGLDPSFFSAGYEKEEKKNKIRFGMGKGIITDVDAFDSLDDETAEVFERALK